MNEFWYKKRLAVLFGSPHRNGHTGRLTDAFLSALPGALTVDFFHVYGSPPSPCMDCGYCKTHDGCVLPDFAAIDALVQQADFLAVATPVYNLSVPAPLKAFLDRTQCYYNARFCRGIRPPVGKQKKAALLVTAGKPDPTGAKIVEKQFQTAFTILNTTLTASVFALGTDEAPVSFQALRQAEEAARSLLLP